MGLERTQMEVGRRDPAFGLNAVLFWQCLLPGGFPGIALLIPGQKPDSAAEKL